MDLQSLRKKCLETAKKDVANSVNEDSFIIQAIANIDELNRTCNGLTARVREWYSLHLPEIAKDVKDNEKFIKLILHKDKRKLMRESKISLSSGADLKEKDLVPILEYASAVEKLFYQKAKIENYLDNIMKKYCRNLQEVAGTLIGAKLLAETGSLKRLAELPSTAIQLLGAEKALFRHLKTGAKPPRYGHLFAHQLVQKAREQDRGKVARALASKLALAIRSDYFGKEFIGANLRKELEVKFG